MIIRATFIFALIAAIITFAAIQHSRSKNNAYLKEATGLSNLPSDIRDLHIKADIFIDRAIRADFQTDSHGIDQLLQARVYKVTTDTNLLKWFPKDFSTSIEFPIGSTYLWKSDLTNCLIFIDSTRSKVSLFYSSRFG